MAYLALDHVQIAMPAGEEDAARAFYHGVLGLDELPKPEPMMANGGAWFRSGGVELHLGVEADFQPARKAHPALRVDHLDAVAARCDAAGHAAQWDERYPGVRRFYVHDPFGNRIEVMQLADSRGVYGVPPTPRTFRLETGRDFGVPPGELYGAFTDRIDAWFAAPGTVKMRVEDGEPFFFEVRVANMIHPHYGRFVRLEQDRRVELTWVTAGTRGVETVLRIDLTARGPGTRLRLTHAGFLDMASRDAHEQAWPIVLDRLAARLADGV
jgi:uncharacterized protein YndB with AHSA1/START domain/catechol 2,3-dioxygenase-like lactoylglutathione lyase family enzyme